MALTTSLNITRRRGDTFPIQLVVTSDGAAYSITSCTFLLTVDPAPNPTTSGNNLFQVAGVITTAASGEFEFRPSAANMDLTPGTYYYDVQMTNASGYIVTLSAGKFIITQDITK